MTTVGVCEEDGGGTPLMILEYMPFGDLKSFLQTYKWVEWRFVGKGRQT